MTFTLTIELGNDAMRTGWDVAAALREVAADVNPYESLADDSGPVRDFNGNTVGRWTVTHESEVMA